MIACFADSFYFFAILNPSDQAHRAAIQYHQNLRRPMVTTPWVLAEVGDGLAGSSGRTLFPELVHRLRGDPRATIVGASGYFDRGIELHRKRPEKMWSLTDCLSFLVMEDMQLTDALTGDRHFEQAGFVPLLK